uniref:Uncharacterized protein n=1 Tax=Tanacetum cinerariifolium TaxID=118510 RepID=A0A699H8C7_TANCI|nr:hypothetical protein [Tanacetum cinerariifolium]
MSLLQEAMDSCVALTRRVEHLEYDKVAQALEITKLKRRVKKLKKRNKVRVLKLRRLQRVGTSHRVETFDDTVMDDESNQGRMIAKMDQDDAVVLKDDKEDNKEVVNVVKDVKEAKKDETKPAKVPEVVDVVTTAKLITEFVTAASETVTTNVDGFKMDYFKGMPYDDIRLIFEAKFNSNVAFLLKIKEQIKEDENRALQKLNETPAERVAKRIKLDEEVPVVDYHVIEMKNKPYYKIIRADDTHQLYVSFLSLLRNFNREDLEALWSLVKERFSTTKPKNFSDDFLLVTLGAMLEKPDIHAYIWKTQKNEHGPAKVKGWKLLESCGVQIITFISTQLILLVERKYPLTRFTLDEMLNVIHKQQIELDEQYARELHAELKKDIDWDEAIDHVKRKAKEDPAVKRYQVLKRKPQTEAQARNNMIMYLKNVVGFKMDYFKGMSYDDIRLIFEAKFNSNVAFLLKTKEQIEKDENIALQKLNETPAERAAKRRKLDEEVEELRRHLQIVPNKDDDVYTEATPLARKVPVVDYQTQKNEHGPAKVKGWKLLESCGVQIITSTSTQLILLAKRKYSLTRFTLDQMLNVVRLEVEEESEVSLELLRFTRQHHQEGQLE